MRYRIVLREATMGELGSLARGQGMPDADKYGGWANSITIETNSTLAEPYMQADIVRGVVMHTHEGERVPYRVMSIEPF